MPSGVRADAGGRRGQILAVLRDAQSPLGVAEIAEQLAVHPNTVRFHIDALISAGRVERVASAPRGRGRPPLAFRFRPGMDPTGPRRYRLLAEILADDLAAAPDAVARANAVGHTWGSRLINRERPGRGRAPRDDNRRPPPDGRARCGDDGQPGETQTTAGIQAIARLVGLLDGLGFAPEDRTPPGERASGVDRHLALHHCPFLDLVGGRGDVICPLHLGLMQGALAALDAPVTVDRLDPFAEPDLCLAHLSAGSAPARPVVPATPPVSAGRPVTPETVRPTLGASRTGQAGWGTGTPDGTPEAAPGQTARWSP